MTLNLTWLGHSCWLLDSGSHRVMLDPFLTSNPVAKRKPADFAKGIDAILISHGHYDHVDDAAAIARQNNALLVANYEIASWFSEKHGVENVLEMNTGGWGKIPGGRVKLVQAWHSSVLPDGTYGGSPGGYIIELGGKRIYFAGDTALFSDMQLFATAPLDAAILPIGDLFTMGVEDSIQATKWLKAKYVLPTHYNTWPPIQQDAEAWAKRVQAEGHGEPIVLAVDGTHSL